MTADLLITFLHILITFFGARHGLTISHLSSSITILAAGREGYSYTIANHTTGTRITCGEEFVRDLIAPLLACGWTISGASASEIAMVRGLLAHNIVAADLSEAQMDDVWAWAGAGLNTFDLVTLWRRAA